MSRLLLTSFLAFSGAAFAAEPAASPTKSPQAHYMKNAADMQWGPGPPSLPPGAQLTILEGDLSKEGFFAVRARFPAGYVIPPHFHPKAERLTIIEGTFLFGMAAEVDEAKYQSFTAGSYISMPPGMPHFAKAKTDVVVQLATNGPWDIIYLNPADDPRRKQSQN